MSSPIVVKARKAGLYDFNDLIFHENDVIKVMDLFEDCFITNHFDYTMEFHKTKENVAVLHLNIIHKLMDKLQAYKYRIYELESILEKNNDILFD